MNTWIARHLVFPLHELLCRRTTVPNLRELERTQWHSPQRLRDLQRRKLRALMIHAFEHLAFYRDRFIAAGLTRRILDSHHYDPLDLIRQLPTLDKPTIQAHRDAMIWHGAPGGLHAYATGGSTGEPLRFYFDRRRQAYDQAARLRSHRWFGVEVGDREVYLWGSPIERDRTTRIKNWRDQLVNHRLLDAFDMSPARMDNYLDQLRRHRPACLFGYPSSIALLVDHAERTSQTLDNHNLRAVFVTGEVCFPHQRQRIQDFFKVPVADGYGSREGGFIAHECPQGLLHITAENVVVEILNGDSPVAPGESGEIVITHLDAWAMPLIRYRTGDHGRLHPGRCACGRGLPLMDVVEGRRTDFLYLPDGTVRHALSIIYPLRELAGVCRFRVEQSRDFTVQVLIEKESGAKNLTLESVATKIRPVVGSDAPLDVRFVDHIPPRPSGKHCYVESHAAPPSQLEGATTT